jgi:predicted ATP-dependent serine protease
MVKPKKIDMGMTPAFTLVEDAKKATEEWGRTDLYSTGDPVMDEYLGNSMFGGYGRKSAYEIITIFGDTGMNKSTFCTSMILEPASKGTTVAYFALEDDPKDVVARIMKQVPDEEKLNNILQNVLFMPENDGYTLDMMAEAIEEIFGIADIVVVDPLQFIFEASVTEHGETEFNRQRLFMRKMNNIMKHTNKTLIIVSHTSKGGGGKDQKRGVDKIIGSSAVAQVSTKVIEINRDKDGLQGIRLWKSRFTPYRYSGIQIYLDHMLVRTVYEPEDINEARKVWTGGAIS